METCKRLLISFIIGWSVGRSSPWSTSSLRTCATRHRYSHAACNHTSWSNQPTTMNKSFIFCFCHVNKNEQTKDEEKKTHEEIMNNLINTLSQSARSDACTSTSSSSIQTLLLCIQANAFYTNCKIIILPAFSLPLLLLLPPALSSASSFVVFDFSHSKCNSTTVCLLFYFYF